MSIDTVKRNHEDAILQLPNVTGIGIGSRQGKDVIKVFVTHKVPESSLRPEEIIPRQLEGYEVDVEESGFVMAERQ